MREEASIGIHLTNTRSIGGKATIRAANNCKQLQTTANNCKQLQTTTNRVTHRIVSCHDLHARFNALISMTRFFACTSLHPSI